MSQGFALKLDFLPGTQGCVFRCGKPDIDVTLPVSMNVARDGRFLARSTDEGFAERVSARAHPACFDAFHRVAYGLPFIKPNVIQGGQS